MPDSTSAGPGSARSLADVIARLMADQAISKEKRYVLCANLRKAAGVLARRPEEIAAEFNLPLEAVNEAIAYCQSKPPEITQDFEREE